MTRNLAEIRRRRERLIGKAAAQRDEVALLAARWERPLALADRAIAATEYLRAHPGYVVAAIGVVVILSPRRAFRWAGRGLALWRGYRSVTKLLARIA
jgi:hypothetical protein